MNNLPKGCYLEMERPEVRLLSGESSALTITPWGQASVDVVVCGSLQTRGRMQWVWLGRVGCCGEIALNISPVCLSDCQLRWWWWRRWRIPGQVYTVQRPQPQPAAASLTLFAQTPLPRSVVDLSKRSSQPQLCYSVSSQSLSTSWNTQQIHDVQFVTNSQQVVQQIVVVVLLRHKAYGWADLCSSE